MVSAEVILFWYRGKPLKKILICCWRAVLFKQYRLSAYIGFSNLKKYVSWEWKIWYIYIRQRGIGNPNPVKLGRCIKELERIYGIEHGGDRKTSSPKVSDLNQSDIAEMIGVSVDTLNNYKNITLLMLLVLLDMKRKMKLWNGC